MRNRHFWQKRKKKVLERCSHRDESSHTFPRNRTKLNMHVCEGCLGARVLTLCIFRPSIWCLDHTEIHQEPNWCLPVNCRNFTNLEVEEWSKDLRQMFELTEESGRLITCTMQMQTPRHNFCLRGINLSIFCARTLRCIHGRCTVTQTYVSVMFANFKPFVLCGKLKLDQLQQLYV